MLIPGPIIAALTFPGVVVHELAHQLFCRMFRVAIFDVCYFRFGSPAGYVVHERPNRVGHHVLISIAPFVLNSILGALIAAPAVVQTVVFEAGTPFDWVLMWLGVSVAMHAFPSTGDAKSAYEALRGSDVPHSVKAFAYPVIGLIFLGAMGSIFWLDAVYGIMVALAVPKLLVALLA